MAQKVYITGRKVEGVPPLVFDLQKVNQFVDLLQLLPNTTKDDFEDTALKFDVAHTADDVLNILTDLYVENLRDRAERKRKLFSIKWTTADQAQLSELLRIFKAGTQ